MVAADAMAQERTKRVDVGLSRRESGYSPMTGEF